MELPGSRERNVAGYAEGLHTRELFSHGFIACFE